MSIVTSFATVPGFEPVYCSGSNGHVGLMTWVPGGADKDRLAGTFADSLVGSTFPPYGITQLIECSQDAHYLRDISALMDRLDEQPSLISHISPPTSLFRLRYNGELSLINDIRGLSEIYEQSSDNGFTVWSNVLGYVPLFSGVMPEEDVNGSALRAFFGYYPRNRTSLRDVHRMEGTTYVSASDTVQPPRVQKLNVLLDILSESTGKTFSINEASRLFLETLERFLSESMRFLGPDIQMGLSGGRDSRLLLSGLIELGREKEFQFYTTASMSQDVELAEEIARRLGQVNREIDWVKRTPSVSAEYSRTNDIERLATIPLLPECGPNNDLLRRFIWIFHYTNGQVMPGAYYRPPGFVASETSCNQGRITRHLSGLSGEILRAPKYSIEDIMAGIEVRVAKTLRSNYGFRTQNGTVEETSHLCALLDNAKFHRMRKRPFTEKTARSAAHYWLCYLQEALDSGVKDFRIFDYHAIAAQQSRRIGLGRDISQVTPLASPVIMEYAFRLSETERANNGFHEKLTTELCPIFADLPYSYQVPVPSAELRRDNSRFPPIWDETDGVPGFSEVLEHPERWRDAYDEELVYAIYRPGEEEIVNAYQKDRIAAQLSWRTASTYYVELLRDHLTKALRNMA